MQLKELFGKVGSFYPVRENFRLTPEVKANFTEKLKTDPTELSGRKVTQVVRTDGLKLILESPGCLTVGTLPTHFACWPTCSTLAMRADPVSSVG